MKVTLLADVQGNWDEVNELQTEPDEVIIHSGNFGFWDSDTILNCDFNYLKQLISFSSILDKDMIDDINDKININQVPNQEVIEDIKQKIVGQYDYLDDYISGKKSFRVPIYTIFGPMDDPVLVEKLVNGTIQIKNLNLIDHTKGYSIQSPGQPDIKIYGLSGRFKFLNLFNSGDYTNKINGKFGELWMTLLQISEFYQLNSNSLNSINIFVTYNSVMKNPILEYLAMVTNANFTVSQGLHFKFPIIGNEMSFLNSIENFKLKFSKFRIKFGELFKLIKGDLMELDGDTSKSLETALEILDVIPIIHTNQIIPLTLKDTDVKPDNGILEGYETSKNGHKTSKDYDTNAMLNKINELYFENFYNLWHFNLCDFKIGDEKNVINLDYANGKVNLHHCYSSGFDFNFKTDQKDLGDEDVDHLIETNDIEEDLEDDDFDGFQLPTRGRGKGRGRGRGRARGRGRSRARGRVRGKFRTM